MLPKEYQTPYETAPNNDTLEKGVRFYVEEIADKNGLLLGKGPTGLLVSSILDLLRLLPKYSYRAYIVEAHKVSGLVTEASFVIEDPSPDNRTAIRTVVTLTSENAQDYQLFIGRGVDPKHRR